MKVVIIVFPGVNCEQDTYYAFRKITNSVTFIWHEDISIPKSTDLIVLPGGFSYGDYLRSGAIASLSPIMRSVKKLAKRGHSILGICNGFQILLEAKLLPGILLRNKSSNFISKFVYLKVKSNNNRFLNKLKNNDIIKIPVAHMDGRYVLNKEQIKLLEDRNQILLKYCNQDGSISNINGSISSIAGITNKNGNVFGLMPHPERAVEKELGSVDGLNMIKGFLN